MLGWSGARGILMEIHKRAEFYQKGMSFTDAKAKLLKLLGIVGTVILKNVKTGENARLSKSSIGKILSNEAVRKSMKNGFFREQHYAVASDIDHLFYNADKLFERPDKNNDKNVKIHRYVAPIYFEENVVVITIKESTQHGKRIYTTELMEIKKLEGILEEAKTAHFPTSS